MVAPQKNHPKVRAILALTLATSTSSSCAFMSTYPDLKRRTITMCMCVYDRIHFHPMEMWGVAFTDTPPVTCHKSAPSLYCCGKHATQHNDATTAMLTFLFTPTQVLGTESGTVMLMMT